MGARLGATRHRGLVSPPARHGFSGLKPENDEGSGVSGRSQRSKVGIPTSLPFVIFGPDPSTHAETVTPPPAFLIPSLPEDAPMRSRASSAE